MTHTKLLQIKKQKKAQKPAFLRRNFKKNKRTRVTGEWRAPRGLHNKLRRRRRGVGQWVMPGYRMPVAVRGLTVQGLRPIIVENVQDMSALNSATDAAILKSSAGKKKRILIVQEALKKNISILNLKDPVAFLKSCEEEKAQKKPQKKEAPTEQKKTNSKKSEEKKEIKEEKSIDDLTKDHKKEEQKQKNKILTKKE